jgi:Fe-S cluster assembly ATPase SufC
MWGLDVGGVDVDLVKAITETINTFSSSTIKTINPNSNMSLKEISHNQKIVHYFRQITKAIHSSGAVFNGREIQLFNQLYKELDDKDETKPVLKQVIDLSTEAKKK